MRMKNVFLGLILIVAAAGCRAQTDIADDVEQGPPPASVANVTGAPLDTALALLEKELQAALTNHLDDTGFDHFQKAEALSDRLLETRYPFQWLKGQSYSLDAKLRQIQALADRILAEMRAGAAVDTAMYDLRLAHTEVRNLRQALKAGGGALPPSLDRLMAGQDTLGTTAQLASEGGRDR
jgi:hypothetical protein